MPLTVTVNSRHACPALVLGLMLLFPAADLLAESKQVGFQDTGAQLGWGWNSTLEEAIPNICVEFEPASEGAQTVNMTISEVSSQSELLEKMDLSATASVKAMVSVEGKASFAKEVSVNSSSSSFLVRATIDNGYDYAAPARTKATRPAEQPSFWGRWFGEPAGDSEEQTGSKLRLTDWALDLARSDDNLEAFRAQCGDAFVQAVYGGAELYGLVTIESSKKNANKEFSEEVTGSYSFVHAGEKFEESIRAIDADAKISVTFFQLGGSGGAIASDRAGFVEKLKNLPAETAKNPKHTRLAVMPYAQLANWPREPGPEPEKHELNEILVEYWNFTSLYRDVQQVLAHPDKFLLNKGVTETGLRQLEDELNAIRKRLERIARQNAALPRQVTTLPISETHLTQARSLLDAQSTGTAGPATAQLRQARILLQLYDDLKTLDEWKPDINWYKVRMPLPLSAVRVDDYQDPDLRRWIVDWYIGRLARRQCDLSPSARGCLSNAQIALWEDRVILDDNGDLHYGAAAGPGGGEKFDDGQNWRVRESRLRTIVAYPFQLGEETPLFGLEFFYDNADGSTFSTGVHGDSVPRTKQTFQLDADEHLVKAELHLRDNLFDAISFTTNKGRVFDPYKAAGLKVKSKDIVFEHKQLPLIAFFGDVCRESAGGGKFLIWPCRFGPIYKNLESGKAAQSRVAPDR
jgi:hypothetical protein